MRAPLADWALRAFGLCLLYSGFVVLLGAPQRKGRACAALFLAWFSSGVSLRMSRRIACRVSHADTVSIATQHRRVLYWHGNSHAARSRMRHVPWRVRRCRRARRSASPGGGPQFCSSVHSTRQRWEPRHVAYNERHGLWQIDLGACVKRARSVHARERERARACWFARDHRCWMSAAVCRA